MGLFGKILGTAFDVVTAPIEVVKDVATMGGACNGKDESYTEKRLRKLDDDVDGIRDEIEKV